MAGGDLRWPAQRRSAAAEYHRRRYQPPELCVFARAGIGGAQLHRRHSRSDQRLPYRRSVYDLHLASACHTVEVCTICTSLAFVYTANLVTAHLGTKRAGQRVKWLFLEDSRAYKATVRARLHGLEPLVAENSLRQWARNLCAAVIRATILFTSSSEREPKDCSADSLQSAGQCRPSLGRG